MSPRKCNNELKIMYMPVEYIRYSIVGMNANYYY